MTLSNEIRKMAKTFTTNVTTLRQSNEMSLREMGRTVGVSDSTVRRIETARRYRFSRGGIGYNPTLNTIMKFAHATDCTPEELLTVTLS